MASIPKVPNTISTKQMRDLQRRADKARNDGLFDRKTIERRRADDRQRARARLN